mmetsp:Transcript_10932/g.49692  ORF Transcript_10932/g.49692 Transcript_10932/m.49692 type:complete len:236 (-) Transcript_10932:623-1330(-)
MSGLALRSSPDLIRVPSPLRRNSDAAPLSVGHRCVIERASYFGTGAVVFGCAPALRCCIGRVWSKHEPDSIGFLERDAPLIFTSQYWLVKSAPATSAVLTSAMVCVSESDVALKRVPAPSAVRFGAGSKQSISGTRRKSAGFLLVVETGAVQFRAKLGDVPEIQGASTSPWQPSPGMPWGSILARCASATACRPRRARHRVQSAKHPWTMTNPTSSSRGASLQPARMAIATMRRV